MTNKKHLWWVTTEDDDSHMDIKKNPYQQQNVDIYQNMW